MPRNQLLNLARVYTPHEIIVICVQITVLTLSKLTAKRIRIRRADVSLHLQQIAQREFPKLFIETIERNNIIQRRSVAVIFCRGIFEQVLVAGNQRKISIMVQRDSCCGIIRNCQVLVFQFLNLLGICQKRFRHLHHPLRCEKGSPRRDSPGCRPREHLQLDHYGKYNARFCICQPENGQKNYVYSP